VRRFIGNLRTEDRTLDDFASSQRRIKESEQPEMATPRKLPE
jgi:hypothetical protein